MKKPDELALYTILRTIAPGSWLEGMPGIEVVTASLDILRIPEKRGYRLLEKWANNGWWDCGVSIRAGWFTETAPASLYEN